MKHMPYFFRKIKVKKINKSSFAILLGSLRVIITCPLSDIKAEFLVSLVEHLPGKTFREAGCPLYLLPDIGRLTGKLDMVLKASFILPTCIQVESLSQRLGPDGFIYNHIDYI